MYRHIPLAVVATAALACSASTFTAPAPSIPVRASSDTAWVDHPRPVLTPEALNQIVELYAGQEFPGACLGGEFVEHSAHGRLAHVTQVAPSVSPERCPAEGHVGVILFMDGGAARAAGDGDVTCRVLLRHPEWGIVGAVNGLTYQVLRDPEGNVVGEGPAPVAWFCGWTRRDTPTLMSVVSTT